MADVLGCRHPIALYDSIKNFALIPILLSVLRRHPAGRGLAFAHFLFWYGGGRFLIDVFRDYETGSFPPGQYLNLLTAAVGFSLIIWLRRRPCPAPVRRSVPPDKPPGGARVLLFVLLALFPLIIPRSWTEDVLTQTRRDRGTLATPPEGNRGRVAD
jgi:phosphatidylglycerol:prolipoprotein diacylglycerol transferase